MTKYELRMLEQRKRVARRLVQRWLEFTPCPLFMTPGTEGNDGSVLLTVRVKVGKADIDRELEREVEDAGIEEAKKRD